LDAFFDKNDFFQQYERIQHVRELSKNEQHQVKQIAETRKELEFLITNAQTIEKYARERYMMKKDNEDLFVLPTRPNPNNFDKGAIFFFLSRLIVGFG
jgi:cell division protein FtsB